MKRIFLFGMFVLAVSLSLFGAMVNAAPPTQGSVPPVTPQATRDPIKQATRRAARTQSAQPTATPLPQASEDDANAETNPVAPGAMTSTILIFNPDTSGAAVVKLDVYDANGAVAYTTTVDVSANGMKLVALPGSLGANFQGGAQISSDKNVQAIVLGANTNKSARDSYEGTIAPALAVTLPLVRHLAANTQKSTLAIQNTTGISATATITLYNLVDGLAAHTENLELAPHQSEYLDTDEIFASNPFVGSAYVDSNQPVAVAAQTLYYKDTAAFDGIASSASDTLLFANQATRKINGASVSIEWSEIFVRNNGASQTNVTLDFYSLTGTFITSFTANDVPVNGGAQFLLNDDDFAALGNSYNGWVKISSSGEPLSATMLQIFNKGKRMYSINAFSNNGAGTRYVCGDVSRMATQNSRISILNTGDTNTKVILRLFNPDTGAKIVQTKVGVPAQTSVTVLLSDSKFAAAGTNYQGMASAFAKGATAPKLVVTVSNPYANPKLSGTTGYECSKLQ